MPYAIEFRPAAQRDLRSIPGDMVRRIGRKIDALSENPRPPGAEKLSGSENSYRIRVGDYRVLYGIRDDTLLVVVVRIRHRREAYR